MSKKKTRAGYRKKSLASFINWSYARFACENGVGLILNKYVGISRDSHS